MGNSDIAIFFTVRKCLDDLEYEPHEGWSEDPEDRARLAELRVSPKPWREAADDLVVREIMRQTRRAKENGKVDAFWQTLSLMLAAQEPVSPATLEALGLWTDDLGQVLSWCGSFFVRRPRDAAAGHTTPYEFDIPEYVQALEKDTHDRNEDSRAKELLPNAHASLASGCLKYWEEPQHPARDYALRHVAKHLAQTTRADELESLLLTYSFLATKLQRFGVRELLDDYDAAVTD